jgi:putative spermidine/putrescine transport system ATP-binding protein
VLSDRIAVFNEGGIEQVGRASEMYEHPRTLFVAGFLGESNVFRGRAREAADGWQLARDGSALRASPPSDLASGDAAALVVRPERMRLIGAGEPAAPGENVLRGGVEQVIYLGAGRKVMVRLDAGDVVTVREPAGAPPPADGDRAVQVAWAPEHSTLLRDQAVDLAGELERM